ncbi:MAG TPA: preprotein translocase subunit YajC [Candidatus Eubacterium pullicola]|nr:preprotein translocase subunit YajC [Candidatus Eubacterium pullicola]
MDNRTIYFQIIPLILLIALMYFMLIRPQKKKEREVNAMRSSIKVGDSIVTIGGICGKVVKVKEDSIVIQVGADKVKFEMMKWSVSQIVTKEPKLSREEKSSRPKKLKKSEPEKEAILDAEIEPVEKEEAVEVAEAEVVEAETVEAFETVETEAEEVAAEEVEVKNEENAENK